MAYKLTRKQMNGDLASGALLHSAPGFPAFPVRLAEEIFLRALQLSGRREVTLWDPCCGGGYLATVLGLLHRTRLREVVCSDISPDAAALASRNLSLLTLGGLTEREEVLRQRAEEFGKPSYAATAAAAARLRFALATAGGDLPARAAVADALDPESLANALETTRPDLVVTDVPYGRQTAWAGPAAEGDEQIARLLDAVGAVVPGAIVAVCAQARKISVPVGQTALSRFRVGTRAVVVLQVGAG